MGGALWLTATPSASRDWASEQARLSVARVDGSIAHISNVRNFQYDSAGNATPAYYDADYDLGGLETAWFVVTTFSKRYRAPAHTFVSFGFADGRYLAISIEARREVGESYGIFAGLVRQYELIYVIGDERDLIGRRAAVEGDATYLYPVRAPRPKIRELFVAMLERANHLAQQPEFYNSLLNSCASNLVSHVNAISPGRIPAGLKVLVPGYTDDVAASLGLIAAGSDGTAERAKYLINARARAALSAPDFSRRIRNLEASAPTIAQ